MTGDGILAAFFAPQHDDDAERLYDTAPCGYLSVAMDSTIVRVNQTFLTMTGFTRDALVGRRTFADLLSAGGRIYYETHYITSLLMQGRIREIALDIVAADGRRVPVLINSVLEVDDEGTPVGIRTAVFDATERRSYERELLNAKQRAEASEARATQIAMALQQTLIPRAPQSIRGLDVAGAYRPAGDGAEVGGDFYDTFQVGDDEWVVTVGDVQGKGVDAALVTSMVRYALRAAAARQPSPAVTLHALNDELLRSGARRFCTIALVRMRRIDTGWTARMSLGGHPQPLLARPGRPVIAVGRTGTLVGALPSPRFHDVEVSLEPGDAILLYTDGVTEARAGQDLYGEQRLQDVVRAASPNAARMVQRILDDVMQFQSGDAHDDIAVVALSVPEQGVQNGVFSAADDDTMTR